jgi:subtilase family serine protease
VEDSIVIAPVTKRADGRRVSRFRRALLLPLTAAPALTGAALLAAALAAPSAQAVNAVPAGPGGRSAEHEHAICTGPAKGTARCHAHVVIDSKGNPTVTRTPSGYGPTDLRAAYGLTATGSSAQTIAIVDAYDDPRAEADLGTYSTQFHLPSCTTRNGCFAKVDQTGGTHYPKSDQGWSLEIALDVQTAHGTCPGCRILLVEARSASFADLSTAEDYATRHATVVSNSWGAGEFLGENAFDSHFTRPGVPITVSSGDSGYGIEYPAASPGVTAVGGTTLTRVSTTSPATWTEAAWAGSGSGCSAYEPKQAWQHDTGCAGRTVADVAADADPNTGAAVYDSVPYQGRSGWFVVGGTSLASPLVAAVYALAGNGSATTGGSYPYLNGGPASLRDVTAGSNGSCGGSYLCTAGLGYDGPTGLGTPQGTDAF